MISPTKRLLQRYLIPRIYITLYHYIRHRSIISLKSQIQYSKHITFGRGTVIKPYTIFLTHTGRISLGEKCSVSSFNHFSTGEADIIIGNSFRTGPGAIIHGTRRIFKDRYRLIVDQGHTHKGVTIGDDVLIGANAVVFECRIGEGAVVGAGSVVTRDVDPYTVVAGVPARPIGKRE